MFDKNYVLPAEALELILHCISKKSLSFEKLRLEECYGRILAKDIASQEDLPAFSRSTVDGYALNSADTFGAKETSPAYITVKHEIFMGTAPEFSIKRTEAAKMPTGGMLPDGADSVVMLEHVQEVSGDMIEVMRAVTPGENVIQKGEDVQRGEVILKKGRRLRPQDIGALAGIGITEIEVIKKPVVSMISTGDEIVPADSVLKLGQIRDINSYTLSGLIIDCGGIPVKKGIFKDDYSVLKNAVIEALDSSDIVLISGGTSAGTKDMTADIINDIGKNYDAKNYDGKNSVLFHGVSVKPGKPMIGGIINNKPVLGLPGHPAAIVVCFDLFIRPVMEKLMGVNQNKLSFKTVTAKMASGIASAAGREDHIRVYIEEKNGKLFAFPVLGKSGLITTLVKADGIVVIPHAKLGLDTGDEVIVKLF